MQRAEGVCKYVCLVKTRVSLRETFENTVALNVVIEAIQNSNRWPWTISGGDVHKLRSCVEIVVIGIKKSRRLSNVKTRGNVVAAKMDISHTTRSACYSLVLVVRESGLVRIWKYRWMIGIFVNVCVSGRKPKKTFHMCLASTQTANSFLSSHEDTYLHVFRSPTLNASPVLCELLRSSTRNAF